MTKIGDIPADEVIEEKIIHSETVLSASAALIYTVRQQCLVVPELTQYGDDIWFCYCSVDPHTDNTAPGFVTYGCILINDPKYILVYDSMCYELPAGSLYQIDAHRKHALWCFSDGLFAALIWDMPSDYGLVNFEQDLLKDSRFKTSI